MPPAVSIVIPCYDLGAYLDEAVESVLNQSYTDVEVIVVDDGSTDAETCAILERYHRPKTRVIRTAHGGLASARNRGIADAEGRYLCMLDADDLLAPDFLARTVPVLDDDPTVTFVSTWLRTFGEESWEWKPERCDLPTLLRENTVLTASLVRRAAVDAVGGFDTSMPVQGDEDWDLWLTLVERGYRGVIVPEVLFSYRRRPGSMSTTCWHGPGHVPLAAYRAAKHADAYRAHLDTVLRSQDEEIRELLAVNDAIERRTATELEPLLDLRRRELEGLSGRMYALDVHAALQRAEAEVAALRASMSWRVTTPLRTAYSWWLRRKGRP